MATTSALPRTTPGAPPPPLPLPGLIGCAALLGAIFLPNLQYLVFVWSNDENYGHGFLVPLISAYFASEAARRGPIAPGGGVAAGLLLLAASILGKLATIVVPVGMVGDAALILGIAGTVSTLMGSAALRRYAFAVAFLVFMIPLPVALYTAIANPLQLMVSRLASALLNAGGIPVLCRGNNLTLPGDIQLFVAEACSGMRQLTGFLALSTAVAYLSPRPAWHRALIVASSIPIALAANVVRVCLTAFISYRIDPGYSSGAYHTAEGLVMMAAGLALLFAFCRMLDSLAGQEPGDATPPDPAA